MKLNSEGVANRLLAETVRANTLSCTHPEGLIRTKTKKYKRFSWQPLGVIRLEYELKET